MDSQIIEGHEFFLRDNKPERPVRQQPRQHMCVCLLLHGNPEAIAMGLGREDKCKREVDNPDQAFCDGCEEAEHHLASNQVGGARSIHRKGKN